MLYDYMHQEKFIELPSVVQLFNKSTKTISPKNNKVIKIYDGVQEINNWIRFWYCELDSVIA